MEQRGFCQVKVVIGADLKRMYFTGVNQQREVAPVYGIVHATIKTQ